ncbi:MAG: Protein transport protein S9 plasma membrane t-SNARE [Cyphobasidiales sp. Tagirdzhanova-0007]|nr:MAG: Protein transport protein S9 plasma membrane t-SNARE [Cyphobasidiales sp. Tagirdzhanova-0007]
MQQQPGYGRDARTEHFNGARPPTKSTGAAFDDYATRGPSGTRSQQQQSGDRPEWADDVGGNEPQQVDEEEDEVEAIKQQIRFTKQESLSTTRNAIRTAREAEETAINTLSRLGEQTDRISNTELALDKAKGYNSRAADGAKEIKRLNQSIFRPTFTFNKTAKRDAEEARVLARHVEEKNDREEARQAAYDSRMRVEQGFKEAERSGKSGKNKEPQPTGRAKWEQGGRYQFEASNSDDELEQELDNNLDEISAITRRLKIHATTAGKEIAAQNSQLDKLGGKVDTLDDKIVMNTSYLKRIK